MNNVSNMGPSNKTSCKWISILHSLTTNLEFYCFVIILLWIERIEVANWESFPFLEFSLPEAILILCGWEPPEKASVCGAIVEKYLAGISFS